MCEMVWMCEDGLYVWFDGLYVWEWFGCVRMVCMCGNGLDV